MSDKDSDNKQAGFFSEFWYFIKTSKRYWLLPIIVLIVLLAVFILFTESSALAPFIYNIF